LVEDNSRIKAECYERVRQWVRARFRLDADSAILVAELQCRIPNCPPIETALAFWTAEGVRHQFKLLKPLAEISSVDIGWLIGDLGDQETNYWDCC
jgi:hypothetical protein